MPCRHTGQTHPRTTTSHPCDPKPPLLPAANRRRLRTFTRSRSCSCVLGTTVATRHARPPETQPIHGARTHGASSIRIRTTMNNHAPLCNARAGRRCADGSRLSGRGHALPRRLPLSAVVFRTTLPVPMHRVHRVPSAHGAPITRHMHCPPTSRGGSHESIYPPVHESPRTHHQTA